MAIGIRNLSTGWGAASAASNADESCGALIVSLPDTERHRKLFERLIKRSTTKEGLDRALLLRIDQEAWGAFKDRGGHAVSDDVSLGRSDLSDIRQQAAPARMTKFITAGAGDRR